MAIPAFVLKMAFERAGSYVGGPLGATIGSSVVAISVAEKELFEVGEKIANGNAGFADIFRLTAAMEAAILSAGLVGTTLGVVAAPGALVAGAVVAAGIAAAYYKNQTASDDAISEIINGIKLGNQPWTIAEAAGHAYSKEVARQAQIDAESRSRFVDARAWRQPVDPLMLDLDGDGLELSRASGSILFDHNADGIRTGTGWIGSDDGILVRDLNGDGTITSGLELFGADTIKPNGERALNGFDALAALDSNADGNFTSADAAWSSVNVWRDLDQDGISDAGELFTLDALSISRIGVVGSASNATGGTQAGTTVNANRIAESASFTQSINGVAAVRTVGAVDLEANNFYREYTTHLPVAAAAAALPSMQGSGRARDLQEAATTSPSLAAAVAGFSAASTRDAQRALADGLLTEWAQSSDYWSSLEDSLHGNVARPRPTENDYLYSDAGAHEFGNFVAS